MSDEADLSLLARWRDGDLASGTILFRRHFDAVFAFFRAKLTTDVDELLQRTFVACLEAAEKIEEIRSFRAYLFGIARLQLLRHMRELGRAKQIDPMTTSAAASFGSPSRAMAAREDIQMLLSALRCLPIDLQIAVELYYWERMPMAEIGVVLGIPEGTVKSRLHRARELLRHAVADGERGSGGAGR